MTKPRITDLIRAEREATPGEWVKRERPNPDLRFWISKDDGLLVTGALACRADAKLIVLARNQLPALLEIALAAKAEEDAFRKKCLHCDDGIEDAECMCGEYMLQVLKRTTEKLAALEAFDWERD